MKYFKKSKLEDKIFHLGVIIQTTDEFKVSRKAIKQKRLFIRILEYEYQEKPRESIVEKLTKVRHIENHIKEYTIDPKIKLTNQDLKDHLERLKGVVQITNSPGAQRKAAWTYELIKKIQNIRKEIQQAKQKFINGQKK